MNLSTVLTSIRKALAAVPGEFSQQVSHVDLKQTVDAALQQLKTPTGVIADVIAVADVVFPQEELYRKNAVQALQAASDLYAAIEAVAKGAAPAPAAN